MDEAEALATTIARLQARLDDLTAGFPPRDAELVNIPTAALVSGLSGERVRQLAQQGRIEAKRHGIAWRINLWSLLYYVVVRQRIAL